MKKRIFFMILVFGLFLGVEDSYALNLSRIKTWSAGEILTAADLNAEFNNITNHSLTNNDIGASAAIAYSKLNLSASLLSTDIKDGEIVNADISASAAIVYSKLSLGSSLLSTDILDGEIVNADISASAGIVDTKLAQITTASKVSGTAITGLASLPSGAGIVPVANLGSGTPTSAKYLRGDGAWSTVSIVPILNTFTIDVASATGTTTVVTPGISVNAVIFISAVNGAVSSGSWGFDDKTNTYSSARDAVDDSSVVSSSNSIAYINGNNQFSGKITSTTSTTFTITWTKSNVPTGTLTVYCMSFGVA